MIEQKAKVKELLHSPNVDLFNLGVEMDKTLGYGIVKSLEIAFKPLMYSGRTLHNILSATYLDLCNSNLSEIPVEIGQLKNLTYLDLENNRLSEIPVEIGQLKNLISLDLENNDIKIQDIIEIQEKLPNCEISY